MCIAVIFVSPELRAQAVQSELTSIDIPQMPMHEALRLLGEKTKVSILVDSKDVSGFMSAPIKGNYDIRDAIRLILGDTPFVFEFIGKDYLVVIPAAAKGAPTPESRSVGKPQADRERIIYDKSTIGEVVVPGTHFPGVAPIGSPVISILRVDIERSGFSSLPELLSSRLPFNFKLVRADSLLNSGDNFIAASNRGRGEGLNFRGLGPGATLVLVDGQRMAPAGSDGLFADLSMIPLSAVERVDILEDASSALYGSDAVAGVVNVTLRKNYEGAETTGQYADTSRGGANQTIASQVAGRSWAGGNATVVYEYAYQEPLDADERSFLTPQDGDFSVWPAQRRNSFAATAHQHLTDSTGLAGNLLYSERSFRQSSASEFNNVYHDGDVELLSGALDLRQNYAADWQGKLSLAHAQQEERGDSRILSPASTPQLNFHFSSRSRLSSADAQAAGPLWSVPGGQARLVVGSTHRRESFDDWSDVGSVGTGLQRKVWGLFSELLMPLVGISNRTSWANDLSLTLAARYDSYSGTRGGVPDAESFDPRVAISWTPREGLHLRSTWSTAFRVGPLAQSSEVPNIAHRRAVDDSAAPSGETVALMIFGGSQQLRPEQAESFTVGLDWEPAFVRGLALSLTYFNIAYRDRISTPLSNGSPGSILTLYPGETDFIVRNPSEAEVAAVYSRYFVVDDPRVSNGPITVIFDDTLRNISSTQTHGLDFLVRYAFNIGANKFAVNVDGERLFRLKHQAAASLASVDLADTVFNPTDLEIRSRLTWDLHRYAASVGVNYVSGYVDNLASPVADVGSWFTTDAQFAVRFGPRSAEPEFSNWTWAAMLSAQNVFDRRPPSISREASALGYDPTHASPFGRYVALHFKRLW